MGAEAGPEEGDWGRRGPGERQQAADWADAMRDGRGAGGACRA